MPCSTPWTRCHRASPHASEAHLAKALIFVQRGRIDAARSEIAAARALADLLPESDRAEFEDRMAIVELFRTGYDLGLGSAVESGAALLERFDRSAASAGSCHPGIRPGVRGHG